MSTGPGGEEEQGHAQKGDQALRGQGIQRMCIYIQKHYELLQE